MTYSEPPSYWEERLQKKVLRWIEQFTRSQPIFSKARWFYVKSPIQVDVYLRIGRRSIAGESVTSLDIANLTVFPMGRGHGGKAIQALHDINPCQITYIESILSPRFQHYLVRNGWTIVPGTYPPSVFKVKDEATCRADMWSNPGSTQAPE